MGGRSDSRRNIESNETLNVMQNALTHISSLYPKLEIPLKAISTLSLTAKHVKIQGGTNVSYSIKLGTPIFLRHEVRVKHAEDTKHKQDKYLDQRSSIVRYSETLGEVVLDDLMHEGPVNLANVS